jgi:adenylate cyclase
VLGLGLPTLFYGTNFVPRDHFGMNLTSAVFLLVYFNLFAWVAFRRTVDLQSSRLTLRKQKVAAEIEKKKSDRLLLSLLPAPVAAELEGQGAVKPCREDRATILVVRMHDLQLLADRMDPAELLSELNYCVSAFDQIVQRHRLEALRPAGETYVAVGGVRATREWEAADAVRAALEVREFMAEMTESRNATGRPSFDFRIAVHAGGVISGLVGSRKLSFDVWGTTVELAQRLSMLAPSGEVAVSEPMLAAAADLVSARPAGKIGSEEAGEIDVFLIDRTPGS